MSTTARLTTAEHLLQMPDDGFRYELLRGELKKLSPASHEHGRIAANVTGSLAPHVKKHGLGAAYAAETGFLLSTNPDTVRAPDVAFVSRKRIENAGATTGFFPGAPDLAVEVISPGDSYAEVEDKVLDWLSAGARLVVVVNPRKRVVTTYRSLTDILVLTEKDRLDGGDVVPAWSMSLEDIFA